MKPAAWRMNWRANMLLYLALSILCAGFAACIAALITLWRDLAKPSQEPWQQFLDDWNKHDHTKD